MIVVFLKTNSSDSHSEWEWSPLPAATPRQAIISSLLPRVYPIVDVPTLEQRGVDPVDFAAALLEGGAEILQFRHKDEFSRSMWTCASQVAALCRQRGARFIVNDRADIALTLDAGAHMGQDDLPPRDARIVLGPERWIGFSTHNEAQVRDGDAEPVDYLAFGPVFETRSKVRPDATVGVATLSRIRSFTRKPLVAIGGITLETAAAVLRAGADSIAIISALAPEPAKLGEVRERMEEWLKATKP